MTFSLPFYKMGIITEKKPRTSVSHCLSPCKIVSFVKAGLLSLVYKCPAWHLGHRKCQSSANARVKKESPSFVDSLRCARRRTKPFTCRLLLPLRASPRSGYDYPHFTNEAEAQRVSMACPWSQGPWARLLGLKPCSDPAGAQLLQS